MPDPDLLFVGKSSLEGVELVQGYRAELGVLIKYYWLLILCCLVHLSSITLDFFRNCHLNNCYCKNLFNTQYETHHLWNTKDDIFERCVCSFFCLYSRSHLFTLHMRNWPIQKSRCDVLKMILFFAVVNHTGLE